MNKRIKFTDRHKITGALRRMPIEHRLLLEASFQWRRSLYAKFLHDVHHLRHAHILVNAPNGHASSGVVGSDTLGSRDMGRLLPATIVHSFELRLTKIGRAHV